MPSPRPSTAAKHKVAKRPSWWASESGWIVAVTPVVAILWLASILGLIIRDQIAAQPPRPPTEAEVVAATPAARAHWRSVFALLQQRLMVWQPRPPELGAVWSTRTGQICGLVDDWHTGVDYMTRFYTVGRQVVFKDDDLRLYMREWSRCVVDPWVVLHPGSLDEGLCASRTGRRVWSSLCSS